MVPHRLRKRARFEFRLRGSDRLALEMAAALRGQSLSGFVRGTALQAARHTLTSTKCSPGHADHVGPDSPRQGTKGRGTDSSSFDHASQAGPV